MFTIHGHAFTRAATPNRVALYIGGDVWASPSDIAELCATLAPGETHTFTPVRWRDAPPVDAITVTRDV